MSEEKKTSNVIEIDSVKDKNQAHRRAVSILLHKLATADSKDTAAISKELRRWNRRWFNQGVRFRHKK